MEWLKKALSRYSDFDGRSRRKEYWHFVLFNGIINFVLNILGSVFGGNSVLALIVSVITLIVSLGLLVPSIAVGIRRLHDIEKSGWFLLLGIIPLVNFYLIYLMTLEGTKGDNQYGPDPKAEGFSSETKLID